MHLDAGAIQRHGLDFDMNQLFLLQFSEHSVQDTGFAPTAHARVDGVPFTKALGKSAPFAAMFGHIQDGVNDLQVGHADIAALLWQAMFNAGELFRRQFHTDTIAD